MPEQYIHTYMYKYDMTLYSVLYAMLQKRLLLIMVALCNRADHYKFAL